MTSRWTLVVAAAATVLVALPAAAAVVDPVISSNEPLPFPKNAQNEPALALDRSVEPRGPLLVAGGNDYRDQQPCAGGCAFAPGIGISGLYLSDDGVNWLQPPPTGLKTLPNFDVKRWSYGDPALASGPRPRGTQFSWAYGTRFYYATLAATSGVRDRVITVSYSDPLQRASVVRPRWSKPFTVSGTTPSADKPAIWADDAAQGNRGFGRVYVCWTGFANDAAAETDLGGQIMFSRSLNGGLTWSTPKQLSATAPPAAHACAIRTDSRGAAYVFWKERRLGVPRLSTVAKGAPCAKVFRSSIVMTRSPNGAVFTKPKAVVAPVSEAGAWDKAQQTCTVDGLAGARTNTFPSVDIANGAPAGGGPNTIALASTEGPSGQVVVRVSHSLGSTWSAPLPVSRSKDIAAFPAVALAPNGLWLYVVYEAFLQPWQSSPLTGPRSMQAVLRATSLRKLESSPATAAWNEVDGPTGDARASAGYEGGDKGVAKPIAAEFLGDYSAIVGTNQAAYAAWTDVSGALDCGPVDSYRQVVSYGKHGQLPDLKTACPPEKSSGGLTKSFGNTTLCGAAIPAGSGTTRQAACDGEPHP
jgi:hypothetical protein